MKIKVYHANDEMWNDAPALFAAEPDYIREGWNSSQYKLVAEVELGMYELTYRTNPLDALDFAYERTNTINKPWWENDGVTAHIGPTRSTSVGDVMELDGMLYLVDKFGFTSFNPKG